MERPLPFRYLRRSLGALVALPLLLLAGCAATPSVNAEPPPLSPMPSYVNRATGHFDLRTGTQLVVRSRNPTAIGIARQFAAHVENTRNIQLDLRPLSVPGVSGGASFHHPAIVFYLNPTNIFPPAGAGYRLVVSNERILVASRTPDGLTRGAKALGQLLSSYPVRDRHEVIPNFLIIDNPPAT